MATDTEMLRRAVRYAIRKGAKSKPAWAKVMPVFAVGSTSARELCRRFLIDPDTGEEILPGSSQGILDSSGDESEAYGDACLGERGDTRAPRFGEWMRGVWASKSNPIRDGMYVRTVIRTGRMNSGVFYELTDGNGRFWEYPAKSTVFIAAPAAAAQQAIGGMLPHTNAAESGSTEE